MRLASFYNKMEAVSMNNHLALWMDRQFMWLKKVWDYAMWNPLTGQSPYHGNGYNNTNLYNIITQGQTSLNDSKCWPTNTAYYTDDDFITTNGEPMKIKAAGLERQLSHVTTINHILKLLKGCGYSVHSWYRIGDLWRNENAIKRFGQKKQTLENS